MGRASDTLAPENFTRQQPRYGLQFSYDDGHTCVVPGGDEAATRMILALWVACQQSSGYAYLKLSNTSGVAWMAGSTVNVELVELP